MRCAITAQSPTLSSRRRHRSGHVALAAGAAALHALARAASAAGSRHSRPRAWGSCGAPPRARRPYRAAGGRGACALRRSAAYVGLTPIVGALRARRALAADTRRRLQARARDGPGRFDFLPFGSGLGTFADVFRALPGRSASPGFFDHAHNDYAERVSRAGRGGNRAIVALLAIAYLAALAASWQRRLRAASAYLQCRNVGPMLAMVAARALRFQFPYPRERDLTSRFSRASSSFTLDRRIARERAAAPLSSAGAPSNSTAHTASVIGISDAVSRACASAARADCTPSATCPSSARIVVEGLPLRKPHADLAIARQVAGAGEHEVAQARETVEGFRLPAHRHAQCARSPRGRGSPVRARALRPSASPSQMPAAIAITFFSAPPSSTPARSSLRIDAKPRTVQRRGACSLRECRVASAANTARSAARARLRARSSGPTARRRAAAACSAWATTWCGSRPSGGLEALAGPGERRVRSMTARTARRGLAQPGGRGGDERRGLAFACARARSASIVTRSGNRDAGQVAARAAARERLGIDARRASRARTRDARDERDRRAPIPRLRRRGSRSSPGSDAPDVRDADEALLPVAVAHLHPAVGGRLHALRAARCLYASKTSGACGVRRGAHVGERHGDEHRAPVAERAVLDHATSPFTSRTLVHWSSFTSTSNG